MKKYSIFFFFFGTLLMMAVMSKTGATLKTAATPFGILNLEFAFNSTNTTAVINAWSPSTGVDNITAAKNNTYYDFLFLFFYATFLFLTCKKIAQINNSQVGLWAAEAAIWAGFSDVLENTGMLLSLDGNNSVYIAFFTTFFSVIKWSLVIIAVLYLLTGSLVMVYRKMKK